VVGEGHLNPERVKALKLLTLESSFGAQKPCSKRRVGLLLQQQNPIACSSSSFATSKQTPFCLWGRYWIPVRADELSMAGGINVRSWAKRQALTSVHDPSTSPKLPCPPVNVNGEREVILEGVSPMATGAYPGVA